MSTKSNKIKATYKNIHPEKKSANFFSGNVLQFQKYINYKFHVFKFQVRPLEEWTKTSLIVESSKINTYDETLDIPVIIIIQAIPIPLEIRMGSIRMRKNENLNESKSWRDLDMSVQCLFGLYLARLDPFECLGLTGTKVNFILL